MFLRKYSDFSEIETLERKIDTEKEMKTYNIENKKNDV